MFHQHFTLTLDGMTAGDYLARVADPEPPTLGTSLASITVRGDPLGSSLGIALAWDVSPPTVVRAATIAGLPLAPEVVSVEPALPATDKADRVGSRLDRRNAPASSSTVASAADSAAAGGSDSGLRAPSVTPETYTRMSDAVHPHAGLLRRDAGQHSLEHHVTEPVTRREVRIRLKLDLVGTSALAPAAGSPKRGGYRA